MSRWLPGIVGVCVVAAAVGPRAAQDPIHDDAASMDRKLTAIADHGAAPPGRIPRPLRTSFTDREVNAFFKVNGRDFLPPSVLDPQVAIDDGGRVRGRAMVDLDEVKKSRPRSFLDPLAYLSGKVEVTAAGTLRAADGMGVLTIDGATFGGAAVPKSLLQMLISSYAKNPDPKAGFDLDKPFALPAHIRAVETQRGSATIVQ